jgi:hypothetical protein
MAAWATVDDVKRALGLTPADVGDDAWLAQVTDAANAWATRRRVAAGYGDPSGAPVLQLGGKWNYDAANLPGVGDPAPGTYRVDDPAAVAAAAFAELDAAGNPTGIAAVAAAGWTLNLADDANVADVSRWTVAAPLAGSDFGVNFAVVATDPAAGARAGWPLAIAQWYAPEGLIVTDPDVSQGVVYLAVWAYRTRGTAGDRTASFAEFGGWSALPADQAKLVNEFLGIPRPVAA